MEYIINKYYFFILIIIFSSIFSDCLYGINHNSTFKDFYLFGNKVLSKHYLIHELWSYILSFIISIFFSINEIGQLAAKSNAKPKKGWIKLIYHDSKNNNYETTNYYLFLYLLTIIIWVLVDQLIDYSIFIKIFQDLDFWMIEFIILILLNKYMSYKIQIYRHQICAMLLSIIASLLKAISIYFSFQDKSDEKNDYTGHLPIFYVKNNVILKILLGIIVYIILITLRSYVNLKLRWYMDIKYISQYKILLAFAFIGMIIYSFICILFTFVKCGKKDFCKYLGINNNETYYFDSFNIYYKDFNGDIFKKLIIVFLGSLFFFTKKLYTLLVIKHLTPVHVIFSVPFRFLLQKVVSISISLINKKEKNYSKNKYKIYKLSLDTSGDIISCIGFLIYLEIIVIKFCNLDHDIKRNITIRSFDDLREKIDPNESFYNKEINEDNFEIKESSNNDKN